MVVLLECGGGSLDLVVMVGCGSGWLGVVAIVLKLWRKAINRSG